MTWLDALIPGGDESNLRPCLVRMGEYTIHTLARDYDAAVLGLDFWCREHGIERTSADFEWDDRAIALGWKRP
jgi:hypothetical protein